MADQGAGGQMLKAQKAAAAAAASAGVSAPNNPTIIRGKRTGVILKVDDNNNNNETNLEDLDTFWKSTKSPEQPPTADTTTKQQQAPSTSPRKRQEEEPSEEKNEESKEQQEVAKLQPRVEPRFSLPGQESDGDDSSDKSIKANKYLLKVINNPNDKSIEWSPSDLSRVSTAPPTPKSALSSHQNPEDSKDASKIDDDIPMPSLPETPGQEQTESSSKNTGGSPLDGIVEEPNAEEDDDEDTEDEEDDLIPPPPAEDDVVGDIPINDAEAVEASFMGDEMMLDPETQETPPEFGKANDNSSPSNDIVDNAEGKEKSTETVLHEEESQNSTVKEPQTSPETPTQEQTESETKEKSPKSPEKDEDEKSDAVGVHETPGEGQSMQTPIEDEAAVDNDIPVHDDDDDDDKEGQGGNMIHDPATPDSLQTETETECQEKPKAKKKGRRKSVVVKTRRKSSMRKSYVSDNDSPTKTPPKPKRKTKKKVTYASPPGYPAGNREYQAVPVSDLKEEKEEKSNAEGLRRSRRAHYKPLAFWKNERPVYGAHNEHGFLGEAMGNMPVVTGVLTALPTPLKKRKRVLVEKPRKPKSRRKAPPDVATEEHTPFDTRKLKKKHAYLDGEVAYVWDEDLEEARDQKVVCYVDNLEMNELPCPRSRKKSDGKVVASAAQAFNVDYDDSEKLVGYIMGNLSLPPKGIKDPESVGSAAQTFTVCSCQPKALELAYADPGEPEGSLDENTAQRFLLSPGDMFCIPPGNCYKLQNHSKDTKCFLTWTIIRPKVSPSES